MPGRARLAIACSASLLVLIGTIGAPEFEAFARIANRLFDESMSAPLSRATGAPPAAARVERDTLNASRPRLADTARAQGEASPVAETSKSDEPRGALLSSLYVSFGVLQGLDTHSTLAAIDRGAREANPVMAPFTSHPAAFIAMKAGSAAGIIYLTERVRRHNRVAAIALMVAANSAYATVVSNNYRLIARADRR